MEEGSTVAHDGRERFIVAVLRFTQDDLCASKVNEFRGLLDGALNGGACNLVVDLRGARFLFSGVANVLLEARAHMRAFDGRLVLVVDTQEVKDFLRAVGLDRTLDIVHTQEEALDLILPAGS